MQIAASRACRFVQSPKPRTLGVCDWLGTGSSQVHLGQRTERIFIPSQSSSKRSLTHRQGLTRTNGPQPLVLPALALGSQPASGRILK